MVNIEVHPDSLLSPIDYCGYKGRHKMVKCECKICGNVIEVCAYSLKAGTTLSCGCIKDLLPRKDFTGDVTPSGVEVLGYISCGNWKVKYSCGHFGHVSSGSFHHNRTGLCYDCSLKLPTTTKHGHSSRSGKSGTYASWLAMRRRCADNLNNRYENYGGRGITVCESWNNSFENFLADMGERPKGCSLDRVNIQQGYFKENCKWSTNIEQANNKSNVLLITDGVDEWSLMRWCEILNLNYKRCWYLIKNRGLSVSEVLGKDYKYC